MEILIEFFQLIFNIIIVYLNIIKSWFIYDERKNLYGKVVVLTGSANGIGKELAIELNQYGAYLALIDIDQRKNNELIEQIKRESFNTNIIGFTCDITDGSEVDICIQQIIKHFGHVDILINNAGIVNCMPLMELDAKNIRHTFDVNVLSHFWLIKHLLPIMIERKSGHIIAISSACGLSGKTNLVDYCSSKHAVVGLMDALDCELRSMNLDDKIHLTTVCPITISTGMFKRPTTKFDFLLPILTPEYVTRIIIDCLRKPSSQQIPFIITIPKYTYWMIILTKLIPRKVFGLIEKFLEYEVGSH